MSKNRKLIFSLYLLFRGTSFCTNIYIVCDNFYEKQIGGNYSNFTEEEIKLRMMSHKMNHKIMKQMKPGELRCVEHQSSNLFCLIFFSFIVWVCKELST